MATRLLYFDAQISLRLINVFVVRTQVLKAFHASVLEKLSKVSLLHPTLKSSCERVQSSTDTLLSPKNYEIFSDSLPARDLAFSLARIYAGIASPYKLKFPFFTIGLVIIFSLRSRKCLSAYRFGKDVFLSLVSCVVQLAAFAVCLCDDFLISVGVLWEKVGKHSFCHFSGYEIRKEIIKQVQIYDKISRRTFRIRHVTFVKFKMIKKTKARNSPSGHF